ncbi:MAG: Zn-dependent hydrolase [Betaproteobacteria bacterium]|nr:MAG: Zn-dependent hydrolase [Betaproteobacteria bacterium]
MSERPIKANSERLWKRLMEMARIGATPAGGCNRQTLTDEDRQGRQLFESWCEAAGCSIEHDQMGNIFARRPGENNDQPPVLIGSHLDTQPTGGKFDGVYGVLAGLEVVESLNDRNVSTAHPIDIVVWTNEEGARFSPAMIGSGVFAGEFDLAYGLSRRAKDGTTIGQELQRIGYAGPRPCRHYPIKAAFEAHIEQGPILEDKGVQIGIVTGVQGMRWYDIELHGAAVHAGPTPMTSRRDPVRAMHAILAELYRLAEQTGPAARVTFGDVRVEPGSRNTVPEKIVLTLDLRHPEEEVLSKMEHRISEIVASESASANVEGIVHNEWKSAAIQFDEGCIQAVADSASALDYPAMRIVSGAGHDSVYLSKVAPTSMIFVPCKQGISHNERESAKKEDLAAGCDVLLNAALSMAGRFD